MPWSILAKMTDDDIKSIYSYLRTIKPVNNKVEKWPISLSYKVFQAGAH
jgi:hypothetical protein